MEPPPRPAAAAAAFPKLEVLDRDAVASHRHRFIRPTKCIVENKDVTLFLTSHAYRDIGLFVQQLNYSLCPRKLNATGSKAQSFPTNGPRQDPVIVTKLRDLLARVESLIEQAPPDPGPRRFGNISFRKWHALLAEHVQDCLSEVLAGTPYQPSSAPLPSPAGDVEKEQGSEQGSEQSEATAFDELKVYFLGSFGSSQRLDYGTGHELSFLAFLGCLWKLGFFEGQGTEKEGDMERSIVLGVIQP